jgi:LAO/AO transport system kinase
MSRLDAILRGDRGALARALSAVEAGGDEACALLDAAAPRLGRARRIGVTGPPGAGKSTLVAGLVRLFRASGARVGVVAVDPSSPFTGGALLGDRLRMGEEARDEGVFVRSLATRGGLGGLARAAPDALDLLDAAGFEILLVETAGVGQNEVEVASTADSVAVVLSPESGDAVQAMKAGLLEIADVLCVNKADREGAEALRAALESSLDRARGDLWRPPVVATNATSDARPLFDALAAHERWLAAEGRLGQRRRRGVRARLERLVARIAAERLLARASAALDRETEEVCAGRRSVLHGARRAAEGLLA